MKTNRSRSRSATTITNSRWLAYATAGAASAFASAQSAEGTIHYSGPINRIFRCGRSARFQLDRPGDFIFLRHSSLSCGEVYSGSGFFNVAGLAGASIAGFYNDCTFHPISASKLERGQLLSNRPFVPAQSRSAVLAEEFHCSGQFAGGGIGYIGFRFNNGSGDQYGWARIQTQQEIEHRFKLLDYAYGDVGDRIRAGQRSSDEMAVDKGSLGLLALGVVGLLAWRNRRSAGDAR